jgi:peptide/nickel transport system substrate-binding protein
VRDNRGRPFPGLVVGSLTIAERSGARHAQLAEAVPTIENGNWKLFPDGRMETTWRLREGVRWHDGQPLTIDDVLFTARVLQDREIAGAFRDPAFDLVERIEAPDSRTVTLTWKSPFMEADALFAIRGFIYGAPLPRHLLEASYLENKAGFIDLPYWTTEFVGSGPYKVREWVGNNSAILDANPDYVLGRPKIDQIAVRIIQDPNTIVANVLAGAIDVTADRAVSVDQGISVRDRWREGTVVPWVNGWMMLYPQLRAPNPPILLDARFRRALIHSANREELAETLTGGVGPIAHSIIAPDHAEYPFVEGSIVRYEYDPRAAVQILEGMGLARGGDGIFQANGQRISIQLRASSLDSNQKAMIAVADGFTRIGVGSEPSTIRVNSVANPADDYGFPGFRLASQDHGPDGIIDVLHSSAAPLPERDYRAPNAPKNRGSYVNPEYDAIMDRYKVTIPRAERMQALAELVHFQTDQALLFGLFHTANTVMIANHVQNVAPDSLWNAHQWDVSR